MKRRTVIALACAISVPLIAVALYSISQSETRANAAVLAEDRKAVHELILEYSRDHGHQPKCFDELVSSGYLKTIPKEMLPAINDLGLTEHCE